MFLWHWLVDVREQSCPKLLGVYWTPHSDRQILSNYALESVKITRICSTRNEALRNGQPPVQFLQQVWTSIFEVLYKLHCWYCCDVSLSKNCSLELLWFQFLGAPSPALDFIWDSRDNAVQNRFPVLTKDLDFCQRSIYIMRVIQRTYRSNTRAAAHSLISSEANYVQLLFCRFWKWFAFMQMQCFTDNFRTYVHYYPLLYPIIRIA